MEMACCFMKCKWWCLSGCARGPRGFLHALLPRPKSFAKDWYVAEACSKDRLADAWLIGDQGTPLRAVLVSHKFNATQSTANLTSEPSTCGNETSPAPSTTNFSISLVWQAFARPLQIPVQELASMAYNGTSYICHRKDEECEALIFVFSG